MRYEIAASRPVYLSTDSINYHVTPASFRVGGCFAGGQDKKARNSYSYGEPQSSGELSIEIGT